MLAGPVEYQEAGEEADHLSAGSDGRDGAPGHPDPGDPYRVLFLCTGNICRSPMGEVVLRAKAAEAGLDHLIEVDSAGTGDWHEGQAMDRRAAATLSARGYESRGHVARRIEPAWVDERDLILALDRSHLYDLRAFPSGRAEVRLLREFDPAASGGGRSGLDVPDPYSGSLADFEESLSMIEAACDGLLAQLAAELTPTRPKRTRPERTRPERTRPERTRPERTRPERTRPERTRKD